MAEFTDEQIENMKRNTEKGKAAKLQEKVYKESEGKENIHTRQHEEKYGAIGRRADVEANRSPGDDVNPEQLRDAEYAAKHPHAYKVLHGILKHGTRMKYVRTGKGGHKWVRQPLLGRRPKGIKGRRKKAGSGGGIRRVASGFGRAGGGGGGMDFMGGGDIFGGMNEFSGIPQRSGPARRQAPYRPPDIMGGFGMGAPRKGGFKKKRRHNDMFGDIW